MKWKPADQSNKFEGYIIHMIFQRCRASTRILFLVTKTSQVLSNHSNAISFWQNKRRSFTYYDISPPWGLPGSLTPTPHYRAAREGPQTVSLGWRSTWITQRMLRPCYCLIFFLFYIVLFVTGRDECYPDAGTVNWHHCRPHPCTTCAQLMPSMLYLKKLAKDIYDN